MRGLHGHFYEMGLLLDLERQQWWSGKKRRSRVWGIQDLAATCQSIWGRRTRRGDPTARALLGPENGCAEMPAGGLGEGKKTKRRQRNLRDRCDRNPRGRCERSPLLGLWRWE